MFPFTFRSHRGSLLAGMIAVAVVVSACAIRPTAGPGYPSQSSPPAAPDVTTERVQRGDIQQTLSFDGDIQARQQISVLPKTSGRIEHLLIDVGAQVKAGDTIGQLEQDSAESQVLQARAALAGAEAKLATVQAGPRAEEIAAAEAALSQQQVRLEDMYAGGRAEDIQLAQAAVDAQQAKLDLMLQGGRAEAIQQAQDGLDAANARLTAIEKGATDDIRQAAQSAVDADTPALASAEAAHAALGGVNAADLQAAQSQVDTLSAQVQAAQSAVNSADAALKNLQGTAPADIQQAQSAVDQAQAQLSAGQAALDQANNPTQASIAQAEAALQAAHAQRQAAEANQTALEQGVAPPCADTVNPLTGAKLSRNSTACGDAKSAADQTVQAGNAAVEAAQGQLDLLKRGGAPADKAQLQSAVKAAQANLEASRTRLNAIKSGGIDAQRAQLQAARDTAAGQLEGAQQNLIVAQARLAAIKNGSLDAQVKSASAQVTAARERLKSDQARLERLIEGPTDEDLQQAQATVDQARQQLALATQPSTQQEIRAQRAAVEQAQLQLQKAKMPYSNFDVQQQQQAVEQAGAVLRLKQNPYTDQDVAAAQAGVDQAQAQLDLAQIGLRDTTVTAPVDGVIAERLMAPGALVNPQTPIVTLVPPELEVVVDVAQNHLAHVDVGEPVQIQLDAFPAQTFAGSIITISPTVDAGSRTATLRIKSQDDAGQLRAGMYAHVNILSGGDRGVLLVPKAALLDGGSSSANEVIAVQNGIATRRTVRIGLQDGQSVEILDGLQPGDLVATSGLNEIVDGQQVIATVRALTDPGG